MNYQFDPTEGFRLLFPESKRPPILYTREETAKIKSWLELPESERLNIPQPCLPTDRFKTLFPDLS